MILYKTKESEIVRVDGGSNGQSLKKYATTITGDGVKTVFTIKHNLDTEDILFEMNDGTEPALIDYTVVDKNTVNITFAVAPTTNEKYNIKIFGILESDNNNTDDNKPLLPDAITDLVASSATHDSVTLSYTIPENADNIKIYCDLSNNISATNYTFTNTTTLNTCTFSNLSANTIYYFAAYATNKSGISDKSNIVSQRTNMAVPDAISNLKATAESNAVTLSYTIPSSATGVKIYYGTNTDISSSSYQNYTTSTQSSCKIEGLSNGTTYYFVVYSYNSGGNSSVSNIANATPKATRLYLYNNGDECSDITGGWTCIKGYECFNKMSSYMEFNRNANPTVPLSKCIIQTNNDLTFILNNNNYTNMYVEYSLNTNVPLGNENTPVTCLIDRHMMISYQFEISNNKKIAASSFSSSELLKSYLSDITNGIVSCEVYTTDAYYLNFKIYAIYFE